MAKKQHLGRVATVVVTQHWTDFVMAYLDPCDMPDEVRNFATPDEAWKKADAEHIDWLLEKVGVKYYTEKDAEAEDFDTATFADQYRKENPIPRKLLTLIERFIKGKIDVEAITDGNGNHLTFEVKK
jgi:hypothetical protein